MERITQMFDEALGNSSYLVDCGGGVGVVVDPLRDVTPYLREAEGRGLRIDVALETHLHADFVSGGRELAARGSTLVAPAGADLAFEHRPIRDGEEIVAGDISIRALATPGHTPEHLSYVLLERGRPFALFSGGALLPGTVARTDLTHPSQTESLTRALHRAARAGLASLPDDVVVYPTHGGGSFCSVAANGERTTTIERERESNPLFLEDEDAFVKTLLDGFGTYPTYFSRLREVNRRGAPPHPQPPSLAHLTPADARAVVDAGGTLIDVRPVHEWALEHPQAALSIVLRPAFATWLGWLVEPDRPLVFLLDDDQDRDLLARECLKIGYDRLAGEIAGGIDAWRDAGLPVRTTSVADVSEAEGEVLDVRHTSELASGFVPGSLHVELGSLPAEAGTLAPRELSVMCRHGQRAATAISLLERAGGGRQTLLLGGAGEWSRATGRALQTLP